MVKKLEPGIVKLTESKAITRHSGESAIPHLSFRQPGVCRSSLATPEIVASFPGGRPGQGAGDVWDGSGRRLAHRLYGPGVGSESATIPDEYTRISDMHQVAQVLALTALDVCNLPC
jgi:hypothetical protein